MSLKQLFISMEDDATNETELVVSADDTLEIEIADAAEAEGEAIEQGENVEALGEISEGLEGILISMESAMQDGGLNPQAALFMQHAVQAHVGRLGMTASDVTPSMESFGGASGQAAATTISMEGITETLKKIWLAIKNAVAKAIQAVKNFFAKIFGGVSKLKGRVDSLRTAVNALEGEGGEKIKVPNANTLRYKGKADIGSIISGLDSTEYELNRTGKMLLEGASMFYKQGVTRVLDKADNIADGKDKLDEILTSTTHDWTTMANKVVAATPVISGDAVFRKETNSDAENGNAKVMTVPKLVKGYGFKALDDASTEIDAPKKAEMLKVLDATKKICDLLENRKKDLEALTKAREEAAKKTDTKVEGWANKIKDSSRSAAASMVMRFVNRDLAAPVNALYSHSFNVARAALALVDRGVSSHKKGPGKKK